MLTRPPKSLAAESRVDELYLQLTHFNAHFATRSDVFVYAVTDVTVLQSTSEEKLLTTGKSSSLSYSEIKPFGS